MMLGKRWTEWGLALAVLCIGSLVQAQPAAGPLPARPEPITKLPAAIPGDPGQPPALGSAPQFPAGPTTTTTLPPAMPPGMNFINELNSKEPKEPKEAHENHEGHEEGHDWHKEEEEAKPSALILDAEFLLMRPIRQGQDYAVVGTNTNDGPLGVVRNVTGGYDPGFCAGLGYRFPDEGWEVVLEYTYFRTTGNDAAGAPPGGFVFPSLTYPGLVTQVAGAAANNSVTLNIGDLEFGKRWQSSECLGFRLFAGPRFADIDQKFTATYIGGDVSSDEVRRRVIFEGFGLRAGGEVNYKVFDHLSVCGRGTVSMVSARYHADLSEIANGVPVVYTSEKFNVAIPVLEMGLGLSYQFGPVRLWAGYEIANWFGAVQGLDFADDQTPGKLNRSSSDLGFDGFVFRAEWIF